MIWKPSTVKLPLRNVCKLYASQCYRYSKSLNTVDVKEINLKVPWGIIAGRHWNGGDKSRKPVICLHGWKDNSATWDTLLPLLVPELPNHQFLALDLPGHGFSSHFPIGMLYDFGDNLFLLRRTINHFGWTNICILGHSFGAQLGFLFSGTHPLVVEKYIAVDALTPMILSQENMLNMVPFTFQKELDFENTILTKTRPSYPYDVMLKKVIESRIGQLDAESCKILMARGIKETAPGSGLYQFTHDIRVHHLPISAFSHRQMSYVAKNFQSEVMYIEASEGVKYMSPYLMDNIERWLRKNNKRSVRFVKIQAGGHHVHLQSPESVLPYVLQVLAKKSKPKVIE